MSSVVLYSTSRNHEFLSRVLHQIGHWSNIFAKIRLRKSIQNICINQPNLMILAIWNNKLILVETQLDIFPSHGTLECFVNPTELSVSFYFSFYVTNESFSRKIWLEMDNIWTGVPSIKRITHVVFLEGTPMMLAWSACKTHIDFDGRRIFAQ